MSPNDAEVHAARGVVLQRTDDYASACRELERAIQLRPRDYFLWIELGITRDLNDDQPGGLAALREAVKLAPAYAKPRWFTGNLLLRMGQIEEAFDQLRFAAERDSSLLPNVIDLAWGISLDDSEKTIDLVQPKTDHAQVALAIFLAAHGRGADAIKQFRLAHSSELPEADQLTERLIQARSFPEAYEVWSKSRCSTCRPASLVNGSFEEDIAIDNRGFGWQIPADVSGATLSVDAAEHEDSARSLRIDFRGLTNPQVPLLSQLLIVEPGRKYQLSFQAMTKSYVSAAAPAVMVTDADEKALVLAQTTIRPDALGWQSYTISFGANTRAVRVVVRREDCQDNSCPAFGTLWLDSFVLSEVR